MLDLFRRYVDSLAGITELPRERAEKLVAELSKRGEVRAKDLQKQAQQLVERSARNRRELVRLVQKEITRQIHVLGLATKADVDELEKRLRKLERKPRSTSKTKSKSKAKTSSKGPSTPTTRSQET